MPRAYLIAMYSTRRRTIAGFITASDYPVTQLVSGVVQMLVAEVTAENFDKAHRVLVSSLSSPALSWVLEYPIRGMSDLERIQRHRMAQCAKADAPARRT